MSAFKITTEKKYDGAIEVSVEGEDEILKNVDMLELVKQAVGPAKDYADNVMKKLDDMEGRIGTVETKVDDINKRLDRIDERLDKFLDRLDRFNRPTNGADISGWLTEETPFLHGRPRAIPVSVPDKYETPNNTPSAPDSSAGKGL